MKNPKQIKQLEKLYTLVNINEINTLLNTNIIFVKTLVKLKKNINKLFPLEVACLQVTSSQEDLNYKILEIIVKTKLNVKIAREKREQLNISLKKILGPQYLSLIKYLSINIEFLK